MLAKSPFKNLKWTAVGPMRPSGRMVDVEAHPSQPATIYAAAAQGGVWKSTDDGATWDRYLRKLPDGIDWRPGHCAVESQESCGLAPGKPIFSVVRMAGIGIYKSVDAGQHFTYMGLGDTQHIARVLVHPTNPDIVYVASAGHEYTFSPDRGVYKTTNGGKSWQKVFYKNEKHRRHRPGHGPVGPGHPVRRHSAAAALSLERPRRERRKRPLQDHRRRQDLDGAHQRPAGLLEG